MKALCNSLLCLCVLTACEQNSAVNPQNQTAAARPVAFVPIPSRLDDIDSGFMENAPHATAVAPATGLQARFTNTDGQRLLNTETNYFNRQIDSLGVYQYRAGQLSRVTWYNGPGADGVWQTGDDRVMSYRDHAPLQANVDWVLYKGAGADQTWFTGDDDIRYYQAPLADANGNALGMATYTLAGEDMLWFTADDFIGWLTTTTKLPSENRWIMYLGAGDDNDWLTMADNQVYRFSKTQFDARGSRQRFIYYNDVGMDNKAFTADDGIMYYRDYGYDAQGRILQVISYSSAGADQRWLTADDGVYSCKLRQRDVNGLPFRTVSFRPGPDNTCFTADDRIWGYHADSFDANGLLQASNAYYRPGADQTWFTDDDVLIYARTYR